jgi:hypothetical protein
VKVKANVVYRFVPVLLDQIDGRTSLQTGDLVRVVNLPGCPKANTMGHCHVADANSGHFIGLVCCNSLDLLQSSTSCCGTAKKWGATVRGRKQSSIAQIWNATMDQTAPTSESRCGRESKSHHQ